MTRDVTRDVVLFVEAMLTLTLNQVRIRRDLSGLKLPKKNPESTQTKEQKENGME